ncbi:hypothetical protein, partial [Zooshikella harenae]
FHQCVKQDGDPDATREELADAYADWVQYGKPDGKNGCGGPPPVPVPVPEPIECDSNCEKTLQQTTRVTAQGAVIIFFIWVCSALTTG